MSTTLHVLTLAACLGAGLVAGLCFTFGSFVLRAFDGLGPPAAIRAMQAINETILRSAAMVVWFGTAILGIAAAALATDRTLTIIAVALYLAGAVLVTGRGNVPLNDALARVDPDSAGAAEEWHGYRTRWARWNALRTVLCAAACVLFAAG